MTMENNQNDKRCQRCFTTPCSRKGPCANSHCRAATCSGFAVVLRYGGNRYTSVYNPDAARGIRADEVWIFGSPQIRHERAIWEVVAPMLSWVQEAMIHRIPNTEMDDGERNADNIKSTKD